MGVSQWLSWGRQHLDHNPLMMYYKVLIIITPYMNPVGAFLPVHYITNLNLSKVIEYFFLFSFFRDERSGFLPLKPRYYH